MNLAAYRRGAEDARKDRAPIFRSTVARGIEPTADDPLADDWDEDARRSYLLGYDFGENFPDAPPVAFVRVGD